MLASGLLFTVSKSTGKFQLLRKKDFPLFLLLAFFEPYIYYVGETFGLTMVESTLASVIVSTIPLFAPVFAFLLLKEKISWLNVAGILVSLAGVFFVIYEPSGGFNANPWGVALLFLAVFAAICYSTTLRKISDYYHTVNIIFYQSLLGLLFFVPTTLLAEGKTLTTMQLSLHSITALLMLAVFASVIAFVLFAWAVREVGVNRTNVFVNLIPVFTAVFAWLLLDEKITALKWGGIVVVVLGLFVSQAGKLKFNKKIDESPF